MRSMSWLPLNPLSQIPTSTGCSGLPTAPRAQRGPVRSELRAVAQFRGRDCTFQRRQHETAVTGGRGRRVLALLPVPLDQAVPVGFLICKAGTLEGLNRTGEAHHPALARPKRE